MNRNHRDSVWWIGGLRVRCNRALQDEPQLPKGRWDLHLVFYSRHAEASAFDLREEEEHAWLPLPNGRQSGAYVRSDGREVWMEEPDGGWGDYSLQARRVVPFAASLQGVVILHAAAIVVKDEVHAIVGESGAGKSTLGRAFGDRGLRTLADDLVPCRVDGERVMVAASPADTSDYTIQGIYFLSRVGGLTGPCWRNLPPATLLERLLKHGFGEMELPRVWALQFEVYGRIASYCKGFDLEIPEGVSTIGSTASQIIDELMVSGSRPRDSNS